MCDHNSTPQIDHLAVADFLSSIHTIFAAVAAAELSASDSLALTRLAIRLAADNLEVGMTKEENNDLQHLRETI